MCTMWWIGGRSGDTFHDNNNKIFLPTGVGPPRNTRSCGQRARDPR